jgi:hypothetical protein
MAAQKTPKNELELAERIKKAYLMKKETSLLNYITLFTIHHLAAGGFIFIVNKF